MISTRIFSKAFAAGSVALGLLLGANAANAADVIFGSVPDKVIGVNNLDFNGKVYNVTFTDNETPAVATYGPYPGVFDFPDPLQGTHCGVLPVPDCIFVGEDAENASTALRSVLNDTLGNPEGTRALAVGVEGGGGLTFFRIAHASDYEDFPVIDRANIVYFWESGKGDGILDPWVGGTDPDADHYEAGVRLWARFTEVGSPTQFTLTVDKAGEGSGTVTSTPSGIDCGSTCSTSFDDGTSVTLTATPDAGSTFSSWSGCEPQTQTQCSVTMTQATTVTVTFAIGGDSKNTGFLPAVVDVILE